MSVVAEFFKGCLFIVVVGIGLVFSIFAALIRAGWRKLFPKEKP